LAARLPAQFHASDPADFPPESVVFLRESAKYRHNFMGIHPHILSPFAFGRSFPSTTPMFTRPWSTTVIYQLPERRIAGLAGDLLLPDADEVTPRLLMLIEGQCEGLGPAQAAHKYGLSRQRYYQLLKQFQETGITALCTQKRGPKSNSVRTDEVERQVIRHRFLDPDASVDLIAQKLRQAGVQISTRSVERTIEKYGLPKKTRPLPPRLRAGDPGPNDLETQQTRPV
jgi:transposase